MNKRGFALVTLVFLMLVIAVMAIALNRRAGMLMRMASNQSFGVQRSAAGQAVLERGLWQITVDPTYRTAVTGEVFRYDGEDYQLRILSAPTLCTNAPTGYDDAVAIDCHDAESNALARTVYRYQLDTKPLYGAPILDKANHIVMDGAGNLYITAPERHRIRKVTPTGTMTTITGTGAAGYMGNGGLAIHARLNRPSGIAVAANGDLYIADTDNHWIRKVDARTGIISLYAGGLDAEGKPEQTVFNGPQGVCVSCSGNVYVADTDNNRVCKVDNWGNVSVFAGTGVAAYSGDGGHASLARLKKPCAVTIDPSLYYMYIADTGNHCIRGIHAGNMLIWTIVGTGQSGYTGDGGPATSARLNGPRAVHVDSVFNMFIADTGNNAVRIVSGHDWTIRTLAGTGSGGLSTDGLWAVESRLNAPAGIAMASLRGGREIFIADKDNKRIARLRLDVEPLLY